MAAAIEVSQGRECRSFHHSEELKNSIQNFLWECSLVPVKSFGVSLGLFVLHPSSSRDFNLFFMAAIFAARSVCADLTAEPPVTFLSLSALCESLESRELFSLARWTTIGRPQTNFPFIFSFANWASCMLTSGGKGENWEQDSQLSFDTGNGYYSYLFSSVLNKSIAPGFASLWAPCVPQEILSCNLSKRRKHLDNVGPEK